MIRFPSAAAMGAFPTDGAAASADFVLQPDAANPSAIRALSVRMENTRPPVWTSMLVASLDEKNKTRVPTFNDVLNTGFVGNGYADFRSEGYGMSSTPSQIC